LNLQKIISLFDHHKVEIALVMKGGVGDEKKVKKLITKVPSQHWVL